MQKGDSEISPCMTGFSLINIYYLYLMISFDYKTHKLEGMLWDCYQMNHIRGYDCISSSLNSSQCKIYCPVLLSQQCSVQTEEEFLTNTIIQSI